MHSNWRDCKAWENEGLAMSTMSNEACKLYDASLSQYVGWYDDPVLGGLSSSCKNMLASDPEFVMGKVLTYGLELLGTGKSVMLDEALKKNIDNLAKLSNCHSVTPRERLHVKAIDLWANGQLTKASDVWEYILVDHPEDSLALKMAHDTYFYLGKSIHIRDSIARVFPRWRNTNPLYGYLHGMYAFGLEETNQYNEALKHAKAGLEINRKDAWATHAYAHVMEMTGCQDDGIKFMTDTENDWSVCGMLACHNYWHLSLYYLDKGDYEKVLDLYDNQIGQRCKSGALLDLVDAASLLYRLQLENVKVADRWKDLFKIFNIYIKDSVLIFNFAHFVMTALGSGNNDAASEVLLIMKKMMQDCENYDQAIITKDVGYVLCQAIIAYGDEKYDDVVEMLYPIRYRIIDIGGSHAQRDVFNLLLINASQKSSNKVNKKLARVLLTERKSLKENSGLTDRLMSKLLQ